jgi:hypothetical protein
MEKSDSSVTPNPGMQGCHHFQHPNRGFHVVSPKDPDSLGDRPRRARESAREPFDGSVPSQLSKEGLAGNSYQDRAAKAREISQPSKKRQIVVPRLAEAYSRIDHDPIRFNTQRLEPSNPFPKEPNHLSRHIFVPGGLLHCRGFALHVHAHIPGAMVADDMPETRISAIGLDVVDDQSARFEGRLSHFCMACVDGYWWRIFRAEGADHRK